MFRKLRSLDEAKQILKQNFTPKPVGVEQVSLSLAHNRVLAEDIVASMDVPSFTRSTVDGYAVKAADTFGAEEDQPIALKLCGSVRIGETPKVTVEKGTTVEMRRRRPTYRPKALWKRKNRRNSQSHC